MTAPCAWCAYYADLERAENEAVLPAAEITWLDAIGQRWAEIGWAILAAQPETGGTP